MTSQVPAVVYEADEGEKSICGRYFSDVLIMVTIMVIITEAIMVIVTVGRLDVMNC